jgi:uncharacterized protein (DUF1499 family)
MRDEGVVPGTTVIGKIADYMGIQVDDLLFQLSDDDSTSLQTRQNERGLSLAAFSAEEEIERLKKLPTAEKLRLARMLIDEAIVA